MRTLTLKNPLDMHIHLREGEMLRSVFPYTFGSFIGGVPMPNLSTPLNKTDLLLQYQDELLALSPDFHAYIPLYLTDELDSQELQKAHKHGVKLLKLYPKGATTNSQNGVMEILTDRMGEILQTAQNLGFILSIHAESNGYSLDREYEFLPIIEELAQSFPTLKIIIEHLSDHRSITVIEKYPNVFATLTLHHITSTLNDLLGSGLNPHFFCKPILKSPKDRDALLSLALQAHPKVSFGSDSAPHPRSKKLSSLASPGIFSAPYLLERLCELFATHSALDRLQAFVSDNAIANYQLSLRRDLYITLEESPCAIPSHIALQNDAIVPFGSGENTRWKILSKEIKPRAKE